MFDEFLIRNQNLADFSQHQNASLSIHGHCYQKSAQRLNDKYPVGVKATCKLLEQLGYQVKEIPSGCCGMAGSFGYESKNYNLSMQVGEDILFPAVRATQDTIVAPGVSCRGHIKDGTNKKALHPIHLLKLKE
jgi:Fe-S oxidoreductase